MGEPLWTPSAARVAAANLGRFLAAVGREHPEVEDFAALYRWSVDRPRDFWPAVWRFTGVVASRGADEILDDPRRMPGARWFAGARLNFAENLLRHAEGPRVGAEALVAWNEDGCHARWTFGGLRDEVARVAEGLRAAGVVAGDRVAGYLPNIPEAVVAMLAAASLGAIWSSASPDFGVDGVLDRFGQIAPKVLITVDGYGYAGKRFALLEKARAVAMALPSLVAVVVVPYAARTGGDVGHDLGDARTVAWDDFGTRGADLAFAQLPFDHPLYILYSSGTTGLPKCMVHGAGGTLLQHAKELVLHTDLRPEDRIFYFTTCGWMMWNWLVSSLSVGATVVLYDGAPMRPAPAILMDMAQAERVSVFGTSAKYLSSLEKEGVRPRHSHDLSALRTILSTGSPLAHESYDYVYRDVHPEVALASISGGTDIVSCFALGNPLAPVYRGELQTPGLGMRVEIWREDGTPAAIGEAGELVCTQAFPSMPIAFWNDPNGDRYRAAYFESFPGVWRHGDWAERTVHDGLIIHGRSDATLNPGGVRIGTAEIYRLVEQLDEVLEGLVVGQRHDGDVRVVLFVRLREGLVLDDALRDRIRRHVRAHASPHHVPRRIVQVADLPRTKSGKITELAVRKVVHGEPVDNTEALANPEALDLFRDLPELRG